MRRLWERADSTRGAAADLYSVQAINRELALAAPSLRRFYTAFGAANRHPGRTYDEGASYRTAGAARKWSLTPTSRDTGWKRVDVDHLATGTVAVRPASSMKRYRLRVAVNLPNASHGVAAVLTTYDRSGRPSSRFVRIGRAGNGTAVVPFDARKISRVDLTLGNAGIRYRGCGSHTTPPYNVEYSCSGVSADNDRPMRYRLSAVR